MNIVDRWLLKNGYSLTGAGKGFKTKKRKKKGKSYGQRRRDDRMAKSKALISSRKNSERSPGEKLVQEILMKNGIRFIAEYHTDYCYSRKTNSLLFFDFFLPDYDVVIEYDGLHHYKPIYGDDRLKEQKYRDRVKNRYCQKKGLKMLRIACFDADHIEELICKFFDKHVF